MEIILAYLEGSYLVLSSIGLFMLSLLAFYFWKKKQNLSFENQALSKELARLTEKIQSQELINLEYKLNPHLFKNILNSIQSHAYQTYFALDKMSNVLDYLLYDSRNKFVSAKEEVQFAMDLIEINKIKLSPLFELKVKSKIGPNEPMFNQKLLAPLITIDLIENAFKHADLQKSNSFIHVTFQFNDGVFTLTVANSISPRPPLEKISGGIGIATLEQRLDFFYKDCYQLDRFYENNVFISHLEINLFDFKSKLLLKHKKNG